MRESQPQTEMRVPEGKPARIKLVAPRAHGQNTVHPSHHSDPSMPPTSSVSLQGLAGHHFWKQRLHEEGWWSELLLAGPQAVSDDLLPPLLCDITLGADQHLFDGVPEMSSLRSLSPWLPGPSHTTVAMIASSQSKI